VVAHLAGFLSDTGILVATFHGRYSAGKGLEYRYTDEGRWREIVREYEATGYGYRDYPPSIGHDYIEGAYGISVSSPAAVIADATAIPGIRLFSYTERGWAGATTCWWSASPT
jgi:hypothetical protein